MAKRTAKAKGGEDARALAAEPPDPGARGGLLFVPRQLAGVRINEDTALTLGALWGCVKVISEDLAGLPWRVHERRPAGGGSDERPDDPADWLLQIQANPETTAFAFRETLLAWCLTWGNGYAEIERDAAGRVVWLHQVSPDRVRPERFQGRVIYDVANPRAPNTALEAQDVFHLRGLGFDGLVGYSVVRMAARCLAAGMALDESVCSFYGNDSTPGGVLNHPGKLSPEARSNLYATWNEKQQGPSKRRRVAILEEGMTWQQTGIPPEDAQLLQQRQFTPSEICRFFRVKPHKIADLARSTFSNIEDENSTHAQDTLVPWATRLEQEANVKLFGRTNRGRRFTRINFKGLLRGNIHQRTAFYTAMIDRGVFSINDVREKEDMNPIGPDGDKRFVPLNMQLLEDAGADPAEAPDSPADAPAGGAPAGGQDAPPAADPAEAMAPVFEDALRRAQSRRGQREADARKRLGADEAALAEWREKFRADHAAYLRGALGPPVLALCRLLGRPGAAAPALAVVVETLSDTPEPDARRVVGQVQAACAAMEVAA